MSNMPQALLADLYNETSKHSGYQVLPNRLRALIGHEFVVTKPRFEQERWNYLLSLLNFSGATIVDIGGNTGFFTFEAVDAGAAQVTYFEGNPVHAEFVTQSAALVGLSERITVHNKYINLADENLPGGVNFVFLLNVLHHIGDDYGDKNTNRTQALDNISRALNRLSASTDYLVFQLGYNWKGNIHLPLFAGGTKTELIDFVREVTHDSWEIEHIGIAQRDATGVRFEDASTSNMCRDDTLGEFLNRPLLIMKSRRQKAG